MSDSICEQEILAEFDRRHASGKIFYDSKPRIQTRTIDGFKFEFAVTAAIGKKPFIKNNKDEPPHVSENPHVQRPTGYSPGSDIDVSGYEITEVNDTHLLAFNKFAMYHPHLLVLTKDGYRRQYEDLDVDDFQAAWTIMENLNWKYFTFFNCGKEGGCSRLHKHIQLAPYQQGRLVPWPEQSNPLNADNIPYHYIIRRFPNRFGPKQVADLYNEMMMEARTCLGQDPKSSEYVPHNLVLGKNWILVIPRRNGGCNEAYANALGMMGMISVANEKELNLWLDQGPKKVLSHLGQPKRQE